MPAENGSGRGLKISVRAVYRSLEADLKSDNSLFFSILTHNSPLLLPALTTAWFWWFPPPCHSRQERDNGISLYHQPSDGMQWCQTAAAVFKPQHRKVCTRHLHCKHLFSVSAASDVLLRDATLVITNLCLLKPGGPWVLLRHYENKQTDSSHKGNDTHLLCLSGNGLCRHESNRHTHTHEHLNGRKETLKTDKNRSTVEHTARRQGPVWSAGTGGAVVKATCCERAQCKGLEPISAMVDSTLWRGENSTAQTHTHTHSWHQWMADGDDLTHCDRAPRFDIFVYVLVHSSKKLRGVRSRWVVAWRAPHNTVASHGAGMS